MSDGTRSIFAFWIGGAANSPTAAGIWSPVDDSQTPNWVAVDDSQSPTWTDVNDSSSTTWTEIVT